jgi:transcriptional regulator with XRE-family HTH domain
MDTFGQRLKFLRETMGIKQKALAEAMHLDEAAAISKYENDQREPDLAGLRIASAFGSVSLDWLICGFVNKNACKYFHEVCIDNDYDAETVAKKLNVTREFIIAVFEGKISPNGDFLIKAADLLCRNVPVQKNCLDKKTGSVVPIAHRGGR